MVPLISHHTVTASPPGGSLTHQPNSISPTNSNLSHKLLISSVRIKKTHRRFYQNYSLFIIHYSFGEFACKLTDKPQFIHQNLFFIINRCKSIVNRSVFFEQFFIYFNIFFIWNSFGNGFVAHFKGFAKAFPESRCNTCHHSCTK